MSKLPFPSLLHLMPNASLAMNRDGIVTHANVKAAELLGYPLDELQGLPIAAIESLAAGRPMVATGVDGTPEVIVDGKTGLTVPSGDPVKLAEAICRLLGDKELAGNLAFAGRRWVVDHFSQELQVSRTQEVYLQALAEA